MTTFIPKLDKDGAIERLTALNAALEAICAQDLLYQPLMFDALYTASQSASILLKLFKQTESPFEQFNREERKSRSQPQLDLAFLRDQAKRMEAWITGEIDRESKIKMAQLERKDLAPGSPQLLDILNALTSNQEELQAEKAKINAYLDEPAHDLSLLLETRLAEQAQAVIDALALEQSAASDQIH